jgi:hypothetical protein
MYEFCAFVAFSGFGIGLLVMIGVIVTKADPHGRVALNGLLCMVAGFVGLIGMIVTSLIG